MQTSTSPDRRQFIRTLAALSTGAWLSACGGGGGGVAASEPVTVVTAPVAAGPAAQPAEAVTHSLNLALNLAYLGAQFHGVAARGSGLSAGLTSGVGAAGAATGGRQASFGDAAVAAHAAGLADDKLGQVTALRSLIGARAAAQPAIDLSASGAFSQAARAAGIVAAGQAFDPYASDESYLLGAFLLENTVAAAYRTLLTQTADAETGRVVSVQLADAIYHGGLVRALLDDRATTDAAVAAALGRAGTMLAALDGSDVGDQTLAGASGASSNLVDAEGRPIPFTRAASQVLKALYLSNGAAGGFLPAGANGVPA